MLKNRELKEINIDNLINELKLEEIEPMLTDSFWFKYGPYFLIPISTICLVIIFRCRKRIKTRFRKSRCFRCVRCCHKKKNIDKIKWSEVRGTDELSLPEVSLPTVQSPLSRSTSKTHTVQDDRTPARNSRKENIMQLLTDKTDPRKLSTATNRYSYHGTENSDKHQQTANAFPDYELCKQYLREKYSIDLDSEEHNEPIHATEKETFQNKNLSEIKPSENKGLYLDLKEYLGEESENTENSELYKSEPSRRILSAPKTEEIADNESLAEAETDHHSRFQERNPTNKLVGESFKYYKENNDLY